MDIITVEKRNPESKAKQLRRAGIIPCVICGRALEESISIQMERTAVNKLFRSNRDGSRIQIKIGDKVIAAQIKDKSQDALTNEITHINFQALEADQKVNSVAHVLLHNSDIAAGTLERMLLEIPYAALPEDMIDAVTIDLDGKPVGTHVTVGDIPEFKSEKIELQVDADTLVFRIADKKNASAEEPLTETI